MFSINTKRLLLSICAIAMGTALLHADDGFVRSFVEKTKNENVVYENNKLFLYPSPSAVRTALIGVAGGICLATSFGALATAYFVNWGPDRDEQLAVRVVSWLVAVPMGALGGFVGAKFIERLQKHLTEDPYLVLDSTGIWQDKIIKCSWSDIEAVEAESSTVIINGNSTTIRHLSFLDKYRTKLFLLLESDDFLPIPFDNFVALAQYYQKTYGKKIGAK